MRTALILTALVVHAAGCASVWEDAEYRDSAPGRHAYLPPVQTSPNVAYGMRMEDVVDAWGDPAVVQRAGEERDLNQRWTYSNVGTKRVLYFENGQLVGWETVSR